MTLPHDPNGVSYEAWIQSKAGACPPDQITVRHDFNDREPDGTYSVWLREGTPVVMHDEDVTLTGVIASPGGFVKVYALRDWPQPKPKAGASPSKPCPMCSFSVPCENNPCGLRNGGEIRWPSPGDELRAALAAMQGRIDPTLAAELEVLIERDWPMPDCAPTTCPTCNGSGLVGELQDCIDCAGSGDWPMPDCAPTTPPDDEALETLDA